MSGGDTIKEKVTDRTARARRISFSVDDDGINESTRTVSWRFELPTDGDGGKQERGEHMIRLLWSPSSSGVARVTLLSSKSICPPPASWEHDGMKTIRKESVVEFTWETLSQQEFRVVAYSIPSPVFRQYELWIDGVSFFDFEEKGAISPHGHHGGFIPIGKPFDEFKLQDTNVKEPTTESLSMDTLPHNTPISCGADRDFDQNQPHSDGTSMYDNMCSFDEYSDEGGPENDVGTFDERCNSERMNTIPDGPQCHIKSHAINMAFSDNECFPRCHLPTDSSSIEANALCDAYDFMRGNAHPSAAAVSDNTNERVTFMHDQLTQMVNNVRLGAISPTAAARTVHCIQMVTGLAEFPAIWEVTVVFFGLKDTTTSSELRKTMEKFGEIEAAAVANSGRGFGFCSFKSSSSAWYAIQGCRNREALLNGEPLTAMRIQNGNWLDPILLSPTTPKRSNLSMHTFTKEKHQPVPELVSSATSSPAPKVSNAASPPKNTPIRFLKRFFKSPKQAEPENNVDDEGAVAPQMHTLDHAEENEKCYENKDLFLPMDEDVLEPVNSDIKPPVIRRRSGAFNVFAGETMHEPLIHGQKVRVMSQRKIIISETSRSLYEEKEEPTANDSNDSFCPPPIIQKAKSDFEIVNNEYLYGNCSDPTIDSESKPLQSELKSPRGVFFGLSPLKPRAIFHRRQHTHSVRSSSIAVTHISDDDWTNDTNTIVGEKSY